VGHSSMGLTEHHSNPSRALRAALAWAATMAEGRECTNQPPSTEAVKHAAGAIGAAHRRHARVVTAVVSVLEMHGGAMHARDVHLAVEAMVGSPMRWASVKACLASNVAGEAPRFVRVTRSEYRLAG